MNAATPLAVIPGDATALADQATALRTLAKDFTVEDRASFQRAAEELRRVKDCQKRLEAIRTSVTGPLNTALRQVNEWFHGPAEKLGFAERALKAEMGSFEREERERAERLAREAQERANAETEELRRRAAAATARGNESRATELAARATEVRAEVPDIAPVKARGMAFGEVWKFRIVHPESLPREYLKPDEERIRRVVQALKGEAKIPGVQVYSEPQVRAGATR